MLWEYIKTNMMLYANQRIVDINRVEYSYYQVVDIVENLAMKLKDDAYAISCSSELSNAIAILACFAAKKTAIPLSVRYGKQHSKNILDEIPVSKVITESNGKYEIKLTNRTGYINNERCVLIMCTSGTTGKPKGVMISEENIIENLNSINYGESGNESILITRPTYHCGVLIGDFLYSLIKGFDVLFYNEAFAPMRICNIVNKYKISILGATPTLLSIVSNYLLKRNKKLNVKILKCSGECISEDTASAMRKAFEKSAIYIFYGMTEACARVSCLLPDCFEFNPTSVGKPLPGISVKIIDKNQNEVEENVSGELIIRGKNVMLGYYNNPSLTFEKVKDSWLFSGDIAKQDAEGNLYILGRKDEMIIRAGINIYPQEIENVLNLDDRVTDSLVYGIHEESKGTRICLDIVTGELDVDEVFVLCKTLLPKHLVPDKIRIVKEIPRNGSGKKIRNIF